VLGICSCLYLIYYLPPASWLRFAAWLNVGFVIYASYGSTHSHLTGATRDAHAAAHAVETVYLGACLGFVGMALLFYMRGVDLWLEAAKHTESGFAGIWGAFAALWRVEPWLGVSWFLVVPLTLNGLVLCPILLLRGLRAKRTAREALVRRQAKTGIALAVALGAAAFGYLLAMIGHQLLR
jgi:hypothetical protein